MNLNILARLNEPGIHMRTRGEQSRYKDWRRRASWSIHSFFAPEVRRFDWNSILRSKMPFSENNYAFITYGLNTRSI